MCKWIFVWYTGDSECKWSANNFDPTNLMAFRYQHPEGENLVLAHDVERAFTASMEI
jgi:hypothetical protein